MTPISTPASLPAQVSAPLLGVVLAGGRSQRMGQDKALLPALQQTAVKNQAANTASQSMLQFSQNLLVKSGINQVVISGRADTPSVIDDIAYAGPLMGLYSVIQALRPKAILALPVDMPLLNSDDLNRLKIAGELSGKCTCFTDNPLPLYLPVNAIVVEFLNHQYQQLQANPNSKGPSFKQLFAQTGVNRIASQSQQRLQNTNTPEEWQQAQRHARQVKQQRGFHPYVD